MVFSELVEINPRVSLSKGEEYKHIEMELVIPGYRYVGTSNKRKYTGGGSKFKTGDTLFARITPCLENGKIAQFIGEKNEVAFGSTEFFVFRAKKGISDPSYIYYLSFSDLTRKPAEKSMSGASGRQRADLKSIENLEIPEHTLEEQQKIASILSAYDDLIENNLKRIKILEEMAQMIYREWFVNFRFPGHEKVKMVKSELGMTPEGWEVKKLGDVCNVIMGQSPKSEYYNTEGNGLPFHQGVKDFGSRFPTHNTYCTLESRIAEQGDILISVRAPVGRINLASEKLIIGRGLSVIRHKHGLQSFLLYQLKHIFREEDSMGSGTIYKAITKDDLLNVKVIQPSREFDKNFNDLVSPMDAEIENLTMRIETLRKTRGLLLPKLINGEIDVEKLNININGAIT
jgi:type I restriction enzyme S subunit